MKKALYSCALGLILGSCNELIQEQFIVKGKMWGAFPRFPHSIADQSVRDVMITYTPDDFNSKITWSSIGYPNEGFFKVHRVFPKLKVSVQACPENRYIGEDDPLRKITSDPIAAQIWRDVAFNSVFSDWAELGNHGLNHSPMGDPKLDHHEFDSTLNSEPNDLNWTRKQFTQSMGDFNAIGIPNSKIMVMRFPGYKKTKEALIAAREQGILAYFDYHNPSGRERWIQLDSNLEILEIPDLRMRSYGEDENKPGHFMSMIKAIKEQHLNSAQLKENEDFKALVEHVVYDSEDRINKGGIINYFDHWWEHSYFWAGSLFPRYEIFLETLKRLDQKYGNRIWWGFSSELARWAYFTRNVEVTGKSVQNQMVLNFDMKKPWPEDWRMQVSYDLLSEDTVSPFPIERIQSIEIEELGHKYTLDPKNYWRTGSTLRTNFEFSGHLKMTIHFSLGTEFGLAP